MGHANTLRVIGQSLEIARISSFELAADGLEYVVKSEWLNAEGGWALRHGVSRNNFSAQTASQSSVKHSVRFSPGDIFRLEKQAQVRRRIGSMRHDGYRALPQLLRALGDQFDRMNAKAFQILWVSESVSVEFQLPDGEKDFRKFTTEKLRRLGSSSRFLRSSQI